MGTTTSRPSACEPGGRAAAATASRSGSTSSAAASSPAASCKRLVDEDGLGGVTSNPAIFEKAIDGSNDYAAAIEEISQGPGLGAQGASTSAWPSRTSRRRRRAAPGLRPHARRHDGYVSLEVSPDLANDTAGTLDEARRLWKAVARPNVMIKVPGHARGHARHPHAARRGHQRQRHPALRARGLRGGGPRLHRRPRGARRPRASPSTAWPAWPASS